MNEDILIKLLEDLGTGWKDMLDVIEQLNDRSIEQRKRIDALERSILTDRHLKALQANDKRFTSDRVTIIDDDGEY